MSPSSCHTLSSLVSSPLPSSLQKYLFNASSSPSVLVICTGNISPCAQRRDQRWHGPTHWLRSAGGLLTPHIGGVPLLMLLCQSVLHTCWLLLDYVHTLKCSKPSQWPPGAAASDCQTGSKVWLPDSQKVRNLCLELIVGAQSESVCHLWCIACFIAALTVYMLVDLGKWPDYFSCVLQSNC